MKTSVVTNVLVCFAVVTANAWEVKLFGKRDMECGKWPVKHIRTSGNTDCVWISEKFKRLTIERVPANCNIRFYPSMHDCHSLTRHWTLTDANNGQCVTFKDPKHVYWAVDGTGC